MVSELSPTLRGQEIFCTKHSLNGRRALSTYVFVDKLQFSQNSHQFSGAGHWNLSAHSQVNENYEL